MTVILDAMGSDLYPDPEIEAAFEFSTHYQEEIILVGDENLINPKIEKDRRNHSLIEVVNAPDVLEMGEKPIEAAKRKPKNSMAVGMQLVKSGRGQAFITAGNTGGAMFNGLRILGRLEGVQRPALTALFPVRTGRCVVLDIGANADCRPEFLAQFAVMGSVYAEKVLNLNSPKVGLLSNGEEGGKGNQLVKDAYHILETMDINFIGNVEGKELFGGMADVVITDGFTGNILLKSSEAVAKMMTDILKEEIMASFTTKLGGVLVKPAFSKIKMMLDPSETGAAPLLGINGLVFVGHGRSDAKAMKNAILLARQAVASNLLSAMHDAIQSGLSKLDNPPTEPNG